MVRYQHPPKYSPAVFLFRVARVRTIYTCYSMSMSVLDRRVQLLLDPAQYERLEHEALRTGQSVAAVIRSAVADRLASSDAPKAAAARRLIESADSGQPGEDWADAKAAIEQGLAAKLA